MFELSQGYKLASQLGHSIVKPVPSLFTFKIDDFQLVELSGVIFLPIFQNNPLFIFRIVNICSLPVCSIEFLKKHQ